MSVKLISTASYLPGKLKLNEDFTNFPKAAIPLIKAKIGIESRHHIAEDQKLSDIAFEAGKLCMEKSALKPEEIGALILATSTPDRLFPATATRLASMLGLKNAFAFDMSAACTNGVFTLETGRAFIEAGSAQNVLIINADCLSKFLNPKDFSTYPYFGDGAGAVILSAENSSNKDKPTLLPAILKTDGENFEAVTIKGGGSEMPFNKDANSADYCISMNGKAIYEFATTKVPEIIKEFLAKNSLSVKDLNRFILHQANINIIEKIAAEISAKVSDFEININRLGNTGGASTLISLDFYMLDSALPKTNYALICGFGAGLCWGCNAIKF